MTQDLVYRPGDRGVWIAVLAGMSVVLAGVAALAWSRYGSGFLMHNLRATVADPFVAYALFDFVVLLAAVSWWAARDARRRGIAVWYWIVGFYLLGTIGLMAYLLYASRRPVAAGA